MRIQSFVMAGMVAMSLSPSFSWALSTSDFYCIAAPYHGNPPVFTKTVSGCSTDGKPTVGYEKTCSEETRCTFITKEIKASIYDDIMKKKFYGPNGSIIGFEQFTPAQKDGYLQKRYREYFQGLYNQDAVGLKSLNGLNVLKKGAPVVPGDGLDGHWLSSHMFCPLKANGHCPMPEKCKGDIQYDAVVADYDHPDVDDEVIKTDAGTGRVVQHQGADSAVSPQEVPPQ